MRIPPYQDISTLTGNLCISERSIQQYQWVTDVNKGRTRRISAYQGR